MRLAGFIIAAVLLSLPALAQTWREYTYRGFAISFPSEPKIEDSTYAIADGMSVPARVYSAGGEGTAFSVVVADLSRTGIAEADAIAQAVKHLTEGSEVTVDTTARVNRVMGRQLSVIGSDGSRSAVALFFRQRQLFLVTGTILPTNEDAMSSDAVRFQQSLRFVVNSARGDFLCELRRVPRNLVDGTR